MRTRTMHNPNSSAERSIHYALLFYSWNIESLQLCAHAVKKREVVAALPVHKKVLVYNH